MNMLKNAGLRKSESGLVSVTVTMIIMIIITLVVSSFALIVRKEQRRALDRQLSTQAFYAAETGIGDARHAINSGKITSDVTACKGAGSFGDVAPGYKPELDAGNAISYSCVLIDTDPANIHIDSLAPSDGPVVFPVSTNSPMSTIRVSWQKKDGSQAFQNSTGFDLPDTGMETPLLRVSIMPGFDTNRSRADFETRTQSLFMYPNGNVAAGAEGNVDYVGASGPIDPSNPNQGKFVSGECNAGNNSSTNPLYCNVNINALNTTDYYVVVHALYQTAELDIAAIDGTGNPLPQVNAQAVIDVTGKASDVLRRVQVRIPKGDGELVRNLGGMIPVGPIMATQEICKLFRITNTQVTDGCTPGNPTTPVGTPTIPPPPGGGGNNDPDPNGEAAIATCDSAVPPSSCEPPGGSNSPEFEWRASMVNNSNNPANQVVRCVWDWGDGTSSNMTGAGCLYGNTVSHDYYDYSARINAANPRGSDGCYRYYVRVTIYFTAASGKAPRTSDPQKVDMPRGLANDVPGGVCHAKWRTPPATPGGPAP